VGQVVEQSRCDCNLPRFMSCYVSLTSPFASVMMTNDRDNDRRLNDIQIGWHFEELPGSSRLHAVPARLTFIDRLERLTLATCDSANQSELPNRLACASTRVRRPKFLNERKKLVSCAIKSRAIDTFRWREVLFGRLSDTTQDAVCCRSFTSPFVSINNDMIALPGFA